MYPQDPEQGLAGILLDRASGGCGKVVPAVLGLCPIQVTYPN